MNFKLSHYVIFSDIIDKKNNRLIYTTRTGSLLKISDKVYSHLLNNDFTNISNDDIMPLILNEALVDNNEDEFKEVFQRNRLAIKDKRLVAFTIQPTGNCQLGCNYCGQVNSKKTMNDLIKNKVVERIIKKVSAKHITGLTVEWYGGEPLMGFAKIMEISKDLIDYAERNNKTYFASIITNGLSLKLPIFKKLVKDCQIKLFQITLDGLAETHDKRRITKQGEKTFDIIFDNIKAVINSKEYDDSDCGILIRINIDKTNGDNVTRLIDLLAQYGFHDKGVAFEFSPVENWGGNNAAKNSYSPKDFGNLEIDWILHSIKKGFKYKTVLPSLNPIVCQVVDKESEVFDADGNIYPCYEFPYTPKYENYNYKIGNIMFPEESFNNNAITRNCNTDIEKGISFCPTCNLFPVCGGGCPKIWYNNEVACPSLKTNIVSS
jgi:uncharacterized protein